MSLAGAAGPACAGPGNGAASGPWSSAIVPVTWYGCDPACVTVPPPSPSTLSPYSSHPKPTRLTHDRPAARPSAPGAPPPETPNTFTAPLLACGSTSTSIRTSSASNGATAAALHTTLLQASRQARPSRQARRRTPAASPLMPTACNPAGSSSTSRTGRMQPPAFAFAVSRTRVAHVLRGEHDLAFPRHDLAARFFVRRRQHARPGPGQPDATTARPPDAGAASASAAQPPSAASRPRDGAHATCGSSSCSCRLPCPSCVLRLASACCFCLRGLLLGGGRPWRIR